MKNKKKRRRKRREGKINDEARGAKTVEKGKSRRRFPLYPRIGKDVTKRKERRFVGKERREREREREREERSEKGTSWRAGSP